MPLGDLDVIDLAEEALPYVLRRGRLAVRPELGLDEQEVMGAHEHDVREP